MDNCDYFPCTIKTVGNPKPFCHVVLLGDEESGRIYNFADAERFAGHVAKHVLEGDVASAKLLLSISRANSTCDCGSCKASV